MIKHSEKIISSILFIVLSLFVGSNNRFVSAAQSTEIISGYAYGYTDWSDYDLTEDEYTVVNDRIVTISLSGDINKVAQYGKVKGYGTASGNLSFSLDYDGKWQDETSKKYLIDDSGKEINGQKFDSKIGKGALMIQKSFDGRTWELAAKQVAVNIFGNGKTSLKNFYTTSGSDINRGCYYRIIVAYRYETVEDSSFLGISYDDEEDYKVAEVYRFFVCNNSGNISIHNLTADKTDIADQYEDKDTGLNIETLLKGETLLEGSATKDGFSIDTLNTEYKSLQVNGKPVNNGDKFTETGKYLIDVTTKLDDVVSKTVYIYNGGDDYGFSDYFGEGLINGNRVSRKGDYPHYAKGSLAEIKALDDTVPSMSGTIVNNTSGETITVVSDRNLNDYELAPGEYTADLFSGNTEAGSVLHYRFNFVIIDEKSGPYRNYNNLTSDENYNRLWDLKTGHYEVAYRTTRGGHIYVCFDSEDEAFKYAYDIEKRNREPGDNGVIYYTALDNENRKVPYPTDTDEDKIALTQAINHYAKKNVEKAYFDRTEGFSFDTLPEDSDLLKSLESVSIAKSTHVFPSAEEREKMIDRAPYLNGFSFIQEGDYDVTDIEAFCENNGKKYSIEFDLPVDEQLDVSSKYVITEKNKYGDSVSYDAYYMAKNETKSTWIVYSDGKKNKLSLSADVVKDGETTITADAITLDSIGDDFDEYAIIAISPKDAYDYELKCLATEAKGLALYKKGKYIVKFVDRTGNHYSVIVNISGNVSWNNMDKTGLRTYAEVYNAVYLNHKPVEN